MLAILKVCIAVYENDFIEGGSSFFMKAMLRNAEGCVCEIKTMESEFLLAGHIANIVIGSNTSFDVEPHDGEILFDVSIGMPVKIAIKKKNDIMVFGGFVYATNEFFWRINHVTEYQNIERRNFFRVKTNGTAEVNKIDAAGNLIEDETYVGNVVDISLSGIRFTCPATFRLGEEICLNKLNIGSGAVINFRTGIIDSISGEEGEDTTYRCHISEIDKTSSDNLSKAILKIQVENNRKRKMRL